MLEIRVKVKPRCWCGVRVSIIASLAFSLFSVGSTVSFAQTSSGPLKLRPQDDASPEAGDFNRRAARERSADPYAGIFPPALFFAYIDFTRMSGRSRSVVEPFVPDPKAATESAWKNTVFDDKNPTWFKTEYGPLKTALRCEWAYDPKIEGRLRELDKEREASGQAPEPMAPSMPTPEARSGGSSNLPNVSGEADGVDEDREIEHVFKFDGATCTLTRSCTGPDDAQCDLDFLETLADAMVIGQRGNRQ